jgi:hypothetical protein
MKQGKRRSFYHISGEVPKGVSMIRTSSRVGIEDRTDDGYRFASSE